MSKKKIRPKADKREFGSRIAEILGSEDELKRFFAAATELSEQGPRSLRFNPLKKIDSELLKSTGLRLTSKVPWAQNAHFFEYDSRKDLVGNPCVGAGLIYMQEAGALEAVELLNPKPGEWVLDLCAAPGGKSTQIGEKLQGQGWLVVNDPVRKRAQRLDAIVARHGIFNVSVYSLEPRALSPRFVGAFDKILIDAPCSGESLFAKRSELRMDVRTADVQGCARRQFAILKEASHMMKAGGTLVYSTCTYSREENEDVLHSFIQSEVDEGLHWELQFEQRRWPHLDGVAGGYCAKLQLKERKVAVEAMECVDSNTFGVLRHSLVQWNGEVDEYAALMSVGLEADLWGHSELDRIPFLAPFVGRELGAGHNFDCNQDAARAYLRGESLQSSKAARGPQRVMWQGWTLGPANATGERLNNLLPKILRELL